MGLAGRLWGAEMPRDTSECVQTMVEGLGKAVVHGYMWVWVGACWHGWVRVSEVSVWHVRAVGAHGEGPRACIWGLGVAGYGRSFVHHSQ